MVKCQIATAFATILARLIVTQQNIGPRRLQDHAWHSYISQQLYNDGPFPLKTPGGNALLDQLTNILIYKGNLLLRQQYDETTLWNDRKTLQGACQYKPSHKYH